MKTYADASFVVALYIEIDNHSDTATEIWEQLDCVPLLYTPLHRLEVRNAIRQFEHAGELTRNEIQAVLRRIDADLKCGILSHTAIRWTSALRRADQTGARFTHETGVAGMDLLHIGVALETRAELFLTFDDRQFETATLAGLNARCAKNF